MTIWLYDDEHLRFVEPPVLNCQHIETVQVFSLSIQRARLHRTTTRKVFDVHKWYGGGVWVYWRWQGRLRDAIVHCATSTTVITIQFAFAPHNMITFGMKWWWFSVCRKYCWTMLEQRNANICVFTVRLQLVSELHLFSEWFILSAFFSIISLCFFSKEHSLWLQSEKRPIHVCLWICKWIEAYLKLFCITSIQPTLYVQLNHNPLCTALCCIAIESSI